MAKKKPTPGASIERSLVVRYAKRRIKDSEKRKPREYERGLQDAFKELVDWLGWQTRRTAKVGGLGHK